METFGLLGYIGTELLSGSHPVIQALPVLSLK